MENLSERCGHPKESSTLGCLWGPFFHFNLYSTPAKVPGLRWSGVGWGGVGKLCSDAQLAQHLPILLGSSVFILRVSPLLPPSHPPPPGLKRTRVPQTLIYIIISRQPCGGVRDMGFLVYLQLFLLGVVSPRPP